MDDKKSSPWRKDIVCLDCGILVKNVHVNTKRCPKCAAIQAARLIKIRNSSDAIPYVPAPLDKHCEGCVYYQGQLIKTCNYIFEKGERRPCPPGKGCTVKLKRRKKA